MVVTCIVLCKIPSFLPRTCMLAVKWCSTTSTLSWLMLMNMPYTTWNTTVTSFPMLTSTSSSLSWEGLPLLMWRRLGECLQRLTPQALGSWTMMCSGTELVCFYNNYLLLDTLSVQLLSKMISSCFASYCQATGAQPHSGDSEWAWDTDSWPAVWREEDASTLLPPHYCPGWPQDKELHCLQVNWVNLTLLKCV